MGLLPKVFLHYYVLLCILCMFYCRESACLGIPLSNTTIQAISYPRIISVYHSRIISVYHSRIILVYPKIISVYPKIISAPQNMDLSASVEALDKVLGIMNSDLASKGEAGTRKYRMADKITALTKKQVKEIDRANFCRIIPQLEEEIKSVKNYVAKYDANYFKEVDERCVFINNKLGELSSDNRRSQLIQEIQYYKGINMKSDVIRLERADSYALVKRIHENREETVLEFDDDVEEFLRSKICLEVEFVSENEKQTLRRILDLL